MKPRIGITTSFVEEEQRLHRAYVLAVEQAGGLPLIVPLLETDEASEAFAGLLDALVVVGGPGITDGLIGELPSELPPVHPVRAAADRRMLTRFLENQQPVLGICYGMQLLNVVHGGTLWADIERQQPNVQVHSDKRGGTEHPLRIVEQTVLHDILNTSAVTVNTRHLQAVCDVGHGLRVAATAPDGVIEAVESADGRVLGVQFHPERMGETMRPLFRHLVHRAKIFRQGTG